MTPLIFGVGVCAIFQFTGCSPQHPPVKLKPPAGIFENKRSAVTGMRVVMCRSGATM